MTYDEIKKILAPCGLNCAKCRAYVEGDIKRHAAELRRLLGSFEETKDHPRYIQGITSSRLMNAGILRRFVRRADAQAFYEKMGFKKRAWFFPKDVA